MASLAAGIAAKKLLVRMFPDADDDIEALGKGFNGEIVTQINQQVGDLADVARHHSDVAQALRDEASLAAIEQVDGGDEFVDAFEAFLDEFGHRASSEIDLSRPRWQDNPATVMQTIRSNLVQNDSGAHRDHLHRLERDATEAAARLEARAGHGVFGPIKKPIIRRLIQTYRGGIQLREYPKQGLAHLLAAAHDEFTDVGESLAADGRLNRPDDVWYLRKDELLAALEEDAPIDADIETRRRTHERYASLTAPPILTSEGEAPTATEDTEGSEGMLTGTPVSAGIVEGPARVVRDPTRESLENGEILIAPSTDPGWTPLFLNAEGLVMEVGGRMTHGALVAREYGIPAVVSVSNATTAIQTEEQIRIDGSRGTVECLDRSEASASAEDLSISTDDGT
jgi:phosphohistidine swiveling domain-containing protein